MRNYILNILIWFDIGANVVLLGGSPYETISSRVGKQRPAGWACLTCTFLSAIFGDDHCDKANVNDYDKALPPWWHFRG